MIKAIVLSVCFAAFSVSGTAYAEDMRQYKEGLVTEEDYVEVQYAHCEEYIDWLNSTWKPTMEPVYPTTAPATASPTNSAAKPDAVKKQQQHF